MGLLTKTPTLVVDNQTIAASGFSDSTVIDLDGAVDFGVGFSITFNGSATLGARLELYADPTGANASFTIGTYDDYIDYQSIPVDAGHAVNGFFQLNKSAKYVRVRIVNESTAQTITAVSAWSIVQTA